METIGQKLKAAREQKGLSQEEVARAIKIKVCYVAAIEKDQFQNLIAPVYAKGFIKLYAKAVGLDPTPLARQFSGLDIFTDEIVGKREEMTPPPVAAPAAVPSVAPRKRRSRPLFAGLTDSIRKIRLPEVNLPKAPAIRRPVLPLKAWVVILAVAALGLSALPFLIRSPTTPAAEVKIRLPQECRLLADPPEPYLDLAPNARNNR